MEFFGKTHDYFNRVKTEDQNLILPRLQSSAKRCRWPD